MKQRHWLLCAVCTVVLALSVGFPALAQTVRTEPDITVDMTMVEIRAHPSLQASGYNTYSRESELECVLRKNENQTLEQYVGADKAQDCADGLNLVIENYNSGIQVTYKIYTEEEIAQNPEREKVDLYYFPAENSSGKYALVLPGNISQTRAEVGEGVSIAARLHEMGYTVFVLKYRVWVYASDNAPIQDLGRAVQYITQNAERFGVNPENYAVVGCSSGGHLAGLFGTDAMGYKNYDVPKPGALILAYPVNNFFELKPVYHLIMDGGNLEQRYYDLSISGNVTDDYPPTYHWYGKNDLALMALYQPAQGEALEQALSCHNVLHRQVIYQNAPHAIATGRGTDAEGWLTDAVDFWEQATAAISEA